jgi:hypothetical protein
MMNPRRTSGRQRTRWLLALALGWLLVCPGVALAQGKKKQMQQDAKPPEQRYLVPYGITLTMIAIGVAVVCLPSMRKSEIPFEAEE